MHSSACIPCGKNTHPMYLSSERRVVVEGSGDHLRLRLLRQLGRVRHFKRNALVVSLTRLVVGVVLHNRDLWHHGAEVAAKDIGLRPVVPVEGAPVVVGSEQSVGRLFLARPNSALLAYKSPYGRGEIFEVTDQGFRTVGLLELPTFTMPPQSVNRPVEDAGTLLQQFIGQSRILAPKESYGELEKDEARYQRPRHIGQPR